MRFFAVICCCLGILQGRAQVLPTFGNSRTGGSGMQFLKVSPDARAMSMGNGGVAISKDLSATYWNPAAITRMDTARLNVLISSTRYFGDVAANFVAAGFKPGKQSYLAFSVFALNYGLMKETTEFDPKGTGRNFTVSNYCLTATYARVLTNNFSFGVNAKFANEGFAGVNVNNVLFDLGLLYDIGVMNSRFGVNFSNFGFNVSPTGSVTLVKFSGEQDINSFSSITVPAIFRLGAAFDPLNKKDHRITVMGQLNHPTDNNETYTLGGEYTYLDCMYVRSGYEFKSDAAYLIPAFGLGLQAKRRVGGLRFDYGFMARNNLGNVHRLTLTAWIR